MCLLILGGALLYQGWNAGKLWGVSPVWKVVEGVPKSEVVQEADDVIVGAGRKSNVLFLLDVGSTMVFTPTGTLPDKGARGWTQEKAAQMLKDCTYGSGGLPLVGKSKHDPTRYGRDLDSSNNATHKDMSLSLAAFMEKHADNYYFPFNTEDHPLESLKKGSRGEPQPYALVLRDPAYWRSPDTAPASAFSKENLGKTLVPNDSRMYKMKLVMWRLLEDPSLFENLRFGMATTFQEMSSPMMADFYKKDPFGAFKSEKGVSFPYGVGPSWATGLGNGSKLGGGYANSASSRIGVLRDLYDYDKSKPQWVHINRAVLRVPIADYSLRQRDLFRMWIDGYEDANTSSSTPYYFRNPELFADGKTYLSTALYPGHPELDREKMRKTTVGDIPGIVFSSKSKQLKASAVNSTFGNIFNAGSGEALGTILDFFSPLTNAHNVDTAPSISFPVKDGCESNWVVVFTAGDDSQSGEYTAAAAALDLFKFTKKNPVTKLKDGSGKTNTFENVQLDDGIRTIVVGFVEPSNTVLRDKLKDMAAAGDPKWDGKDWVPDYDKEPYFANDVPELIEALREIMGRINTDLRPAKGPMTESASLETTDDSGGFDLFAASYRVNMNDQWQGQLFRIQSSINAALEIKVKQPPKWELGSALMNNRTQSATGGRRLVYWDGSAFKRLNYSTGSGEYSEDVAKMLGLRTSDLLTKSKYEGKLHPSRAMINWLHGYDYSYGKTQETPRNFMLSDFGQSGVTMVIPPKSAMIDLPGYADWVNLSSIQKRATRLFAQSNEGILHVINPTASGASLEDLAILPPPVMQPYRLAATKFTVTKTGNDALVEWDDSAISSKTGTGYFSRPVYVLDGALYLRDFDLAQSGRAGGWGTYLTGMLGRAGNGLYFMEVTQPDSPRFLWFRETRYQADGRPVFITMGGGASEPTYTQDTDTDMGSGSPIFSNPDQYPFYQMGYNMPRPVAGVAHLPNDSRRNFLALAGGMQEKLDLANNGYTGAAVYLINPRDAYRTSVGSQGTKVFNSGSLSSMPSALRTGTMTTGEDPYMGMVITPPALWRSSRNKSIASKVFTADNRGNVFMINIEGGFGADASSQSESKWTIQTVGTLRARNGEASAKDNHSIPHGLLVAGDANGATLWVSGGTANTGTRNNNNSNDNSAMIRNKGQHIFAFKVDPQRALYRDDLTSLVDDSDTIGPDANGWYIALQGGGKGFDEEYVSARPVLVGGALYCATFLPKKSASACGGMVDGTSRIYAISLTTGAGAWQGGVTSRHIDIRGIKITSLTHSKRGSAETIIVDYYTTDKEAAKIDMDKHADDGNIIPGNENSNKFTVPVPPSGGSGVPFPPLSTFINYWRDVK